MNKSLEYILRKTKAREKETELVITLSALYNIEPFKRFILRKVRGEAKVRDTGEVFADFIYDPDADFNYYESEIAEDGDILKAAKEILKKINDLESYYPSAVEDVEVDRILDYVIHYIVGDFIAREWSEGEKKVIEVELPIRYEVEERK